MYKDITIYYYLVVLVLEKQNRRLSSSCGWAPISVQRGRERERGGVETSLPLALSTAGRIRRSQIELDRKGRPGLDLQETALQRYTITACLLSCVCGKCVSPLTIFVCVSYCSVMSYLVNVSSCYILQCKNWIKVYAF